jgi:hypothetical protein
LIIGAPGEDIGRKRSGRDAGTITVLDRSTFGPDHRGSCGPMLVRQGNGRPAAIPAPDAGSAVLMLPGMAERGDHLGQALGAMPGLHQNEDDWGVTLLAGAPGEDIRGKADAGVVACGRTGRALFAGLTSLAFRRGPTSGLAFGSVFATYQSGDR